MADKTSAGLPKWIQSSKETISKSKEWETFITEIHNALDQNLQENQTASFTETEWISFLEKTTKDIKNGEAYNKITSIIGQILESHANMEVGQEIMDEQPVNSKGEIFLKCIHKASHNMFLHRPELKTKFNACINQILNLPTRQLMWHIFLENSKLRKHYVDILKMNPRSAISPQDRTISKKCDHLLNSEPTFEVMKGSVGVFYGMKALLSFYHTSKQTKIPLNDEDYLLTIPFVYLESASMERTKPASGEVVALLVEQFFTFMNNRPKYLLPDKDGDSYKTVIQQVVEILHEKDKDVEALFVKMYSTKEQIVATETGKKAVLLSALEFLLKPLLLSVFVGYLNLECVLFVWDQFILGWQSPVFQQKVLAAVCAALLILCKGPLFNCRTAEDVEKCLKRECHKLTAQQFQNMIDQHFYSQLFSLLNDKGSSIIPVVDKRQGKVIPWKVQQDVTPVKSSSKEPEQDILKHQEEIKRLKEEKDQALRKQEDIRKELQDVVEQERKARFQVEREAEREIEKLRRELEDLRMRGKTMASSHSQLQSQRSLASGLLPPMGSPISDLPTPQTTPQTQMTQSPQRESSGQQEIDREKANEIGVELLRKIASGFSKVGHAEL